MSEVRRDYKDTVFRLLFKKPENLLTLYNAVNGTNYTNVEDMEITTLENAIYMNVKNDVSCVFDFQLNLYEHQSTVNPNIPLRNLIYVADQLKPMVQPEELYGRKLRKIPTPRFVVFYNGLETMPERSEYRLSDLFSKPMEKPELELIVTVYNINPGMNVQLLECCRVLKEYMLFVMKVRENRKRMEFKEAINKAVDDCIEEGILKEFLWENKAEAVAVSIYEFDEEKYRKIIREESVAEGIEIGKEIGKEIGIYAFISDKLEDNVPVNCIVEKVVKHFGIEPERVEEYINKYDRT